MALGQCLEYEYNRAPDAKVLVADRTFRADVVADPVVLVDVSAVDPEKRDGENEGDSCRPGEIGAARATVCARYNPSQQTGEDQDEVGAGKKAEEERQRDREAEKHRAAPRAEAVGQERRGTGHAEGAHREVIESKVESGAGDVFPGPGGERQQCGGKGQAGPPGDPRHRDEERELPGDEGEGGAARRAGKLEGEQRRGVVECALRRRIGQREQQRGDESGGAGVFSRVVSVSKILYLVIPLRVHAGVVTRAELIEEERLQREHAEQQSHPGQRGGPGLSDPCGRRCRPIRGRSGRGSARAHFRAS